MPSKRFRESLRWILSESGQLLSIEASGKTYIRSLEGGEWCVGTMSDDGSIVDENCRSDVNAAIDDYINRVTELNDW